MHCTFDPPPKKRVGSVVRLLSYVCTQIPPSALPCRLPRCCLLQSACPVCLGACWELEGGRSHRGRVARETSACVRACVRYLCVSESERQRESRTGNQRTRAHTHTRALSVFHRLLLTPDELSATVKSAESRHTHAGSCAVLFFFFLRWWLVLCRGARCLAEDSLAGTGSWFPPQQRLPGRRGHEELKASLVLSSI